ncbi:MAG: hypothetical protein JWR18_3405 [Segetibacter sp.]|nr:hypothetical protein [Segetibacter sp.]
MDSERCRITCLFGSSRYDAQSSRYRLSPKVQVENVGGEIHNEARVPSEEPEQCNKHIGRQD